jgi:hypothetical protein
MDLHLDYCSLSDLDYSPLPDLANLEWQSFHPFIHSEGGSESQNWDFLNTPPNLHQSLDINQLSQDGLPALRNTTPKRLISVINHKEPFSSTEASTQQPGRERIAKKRKLSMDKDPQIQGFFRFSVNSEDPTVSQRAPTSLRKAEVNKVAKIHACLRCQLLKKPVSYSLLKNIFALWLIILQCSEGVQCIRCKRTGQSTRASLSFKWMDCIRPSLVSICIFNRGKIESFSNDQ